MEHERKLHAASDVLARNARAARLNVSSSLVHTGSQVFRNRSVSPLAASSPGLERAAPSRRGAGPKIRLEVPVVGADAAAPAVLSARLASEQSMAAWSSRDKRTHSPKFQAAQLLSKLEADLRASALDPRGSMAGFLPDSMASSDARVLTACRHAMHAVADALPSWKPLLDRIQALTDQTTSRLESMTATIPMLEAHAAKLGDAYRRDGQVTSEMAAERVALAASERDRAMEQVALLKRRLNETEQALRGMEDRVVAAERVSQTLRESNDALVSAYRRGEAASSEAERRAGEMLQEMTGLRKAAESSAEEAEQGRQQIKLLHRKLKTMVPKQDLTQTQSLLQATRMEVTELKSALQSYALAASKVSLPPRSSSSGSTLDSPTPVAVGSASNRSFVPFASGGTSSSSEWQALLRELDLAAHPLLVHVQQQLDGSVVLSGGGVSAMLSAVRRDDRPIIDTTAHADLKDDHSEEDDSDGYGSENDAAWTSSGDPVFRRGVPILPPSHPVLRPRFLVARGATDDVPRYLRAFGLIRQREISKQDLERLVKACWTAKLQFDAEQQRMGRLDRAPLSEFFWDWLRSRFGGPGAAVEWGSSIVASLHRFSYDADIDVFLRCLQGRLPEDVFRQGNLLVQRLYEGLRGRDKSLSGGQVTGLLSVDDIRSYLREAFPEKDAASMAAVLAALAIDPAVQAAPGAAAATQRGGAIGLSPADSLSGTERVDYSRLIAENAVGDQGPFVETLRAQLVQDYLQYAAEITSSIRDASVGTDEDRHIAPASALDAIVRIDPTKPYPEAFAMVARGAGVHPSELALDKAPALPLEPFLTKLRFGWMQRSGTKAAV
jgi:hypothetical protein